MERSDVVGKMRAYRAELAAELHRLDNALAALGVPAEDHPPSARGDATGNAEPGTFDLLRDLIGERPQVDAPAALEYLIMHGWNSEARNPLNAVRTALAHLASWGELERIARGVYRPAREDVHEPPGSLQLHTPATIVADIAVPA